MLKNIIGAAVGSKLAKQPAKGGAAGAALATAVPFVLSRISLPAMVVLGAGGYLTKRFLDKKKREDASQTAKDISGVALAKPGEAPDAETGSVINPPTGAKVNGAGKANEAVAQD